MKKILFFALCSILMKNSYSQCLSISCPSNISVSSAVNSCSSTINYSAPVVINNCGTNSFTFSFTGATQTFVVPSGVTMITMEAWGAQGGANWVNNTNFGGYAKGDFAVTPGQTLAVNVGGQATSITGGFNGGGNGEGAGRGGGGGSDVRIAGFTLNDRVIVAGGGGGAGYWSNLHVVGGVGGGLTGGDGYRDPNYASNPGGQGATQTGSGYGTCVSFSNVAMAGGFGYGGSPSGCGCEGYGGGGGWYGGAGSGNCRGGGGGSGYLLPSSTNTLFTSGLTVGNGSVILTYTGTSTYTTSLVNGLTSGSSFPTGTTVQTFTVVDNNSNSNTCSFSVTVNDVQTPTIVCPANYTSCAVAISSIAPISVIDNCSASVTYSLTGATTSTGVTNASGIFNIGITTVNYEAMDPSGNFSGCSFSVTVNTTPTVSIANSNTVICTGQSATLTANGAATYSWNTSSSSNTIVVSPTVTTTYSVTGTNSVNCSDQSSSTVSVSLCTGIESISQTQTFELYPNPNNGDFIIQLAYKSKLVIYTVLGKIIYTDEKNEGTHPVSITEQPVGIYFIDVITENGKKTFKLIKN